jgi:hypothetical protein
MSYLTIWCALIVLVSAGCCPRAETPAEPTAPAPLQSFALPRAPLWLPRMDCMPRDWADDIVVADMRWNIITGKWDIDMESTYRPPRCSANARPEPDR